MQLIGLCHVIYVDENRENAENQENAKNPEEAKKLPENLAKSLSQLSKLGVQEGIISVNDSFGPMLDKIGEKMFPLQNLTEVNKRMGIFTPKNEHANLSILSS